MTMTEIPRFFTTDEDSSRWDGFEFRPGDVVISAQMKAGTTWVQAIIGHLIFGPVLPGKLSDLSPWMDWTGDPVADVHAKLAAQQHRRFIKTHTSLEHLPGVHGVKYVVVVRDPLDCAVSLWHQQANLKVFAGELGSLTDRLSEFITADGTSLQGIRLPNAARAIDFAYHYRGHPDVHVIRYEDLCADPGGEIAALASALNIWVSPQQLNSIRTATSLDVMRGSAGDLVPLPHLFRDDRAFFRAGHPGASLESVTPDEYQRYQVRLAGLMSAEAHAWLTEACAISDLHLARNIHLQRTCWGDFA